MRLSEHVYSTISSTKGPLLFGEYVFSARVGEVVAVFFADGTETEGEVLKTGKDSVFLRAYGKRGSP